MHRGSIMVPSLLYIIIILNPMWQHSPLSTLVHTGCSDYNAPSKLSGGELWVMGHIHQVGGVSPGAVEPNHVARWRDGELLHNRLVMRYAIILWRVGWGTLAQLRTHRSIPQHTCTHHLHTAHIHAHIFTHIHTYTGVFPTHTHNLAFLPLPLPPPPTHTHIQIITQKEQPMKWV